MQHQINVVIVTNAVLKSHLIENINIFDFNLDGEDMKISIRSTTIIASLYSYMMSITGTTRIKMNIDVSNAKLRL